jgi:nitrite reductase/ring-hydroxylating ferredoxin subunit
MSSDSNEWVTVGALSKLAAGEMTGVQIGSHEVALYNLGGQIRATDNLCTHAFAYLTDGWLEDGVVECPLHGGRFEVETGKGMGPPIPCDVAVHEVRVVGDDIQVKLAPEKK